MMNGAVGYQVLDDGTLLSLGLIFGSAAALFVGTGYIALDTGFSWTGYWDSTLTAPNRSYSLYTLYQLVPLVFLTIYFLLQAYLVLRVLGEKRPMRMLIFTIVSNQYCNANLTILVYLIGATLLFAISQIFQYVISVHLCNATNGAINGGLFETLFVLLAVITLWIFWSSITEDDWPLPVAPGSTYS